MITNFLNDINKGKVGEEIFKKDFLEFLNINYYDVTECQQFQILDSDYFTSIGIYEIKLNYKDDNRIFIEEYTNINESLGKISYGWFYKSNADLLVFISNNSRVMILIPFNKKFKNHYENIKDNFKLYRNKISLYNNNKWQSAFRIIPLEILSGYYSKYKKY